MVPHFDGRLHTYFGGTRSLCFTDMQHGSVESCFASLDACVYTSNSFQLNWPSLNS